MKKMIILSLIILFNANISIADVYVNSYTKQNGTYVNGHYRTSPNSTTYDNYSTKGNYNPYTGDSGTKNPYSNSYGPSYSNSSNSYSNSNRNSRYGF